MIKLTITVFEQVRHKLVRRLEAWNIGFMKKREYTIRENKDADQLCSYCTADLRTCVRICGLLVSSCGGSYVLDLNLSKLIKVPTGRE